MPYTDIEDTLAAYGLPELPEPVDDPDEYEEGELAELVLFRFQDKRISLGDGYLLADAMEYCQDEDTHSDGWFVGFYKR